MTRDEFSAKYKLLKQIDGGDGRSYTAEHRPTGRAVLVHFLPADSPSSRALPELIGRLGPRDASKITDTLSVDGSPVVVSEFIETQGSFERWLQVRSGTPVAPPDSASSVIPSAAPRRGGGEFTQLFRGHADSEPSRGVADLDSPPRHDPPAPAAPGSFTAMFQRQGEAGSPAEVPLPTPAGPSVPIRSLRVAPPVTPPVAPPARPRVEPPIPAQGFDPPPAYALPPAVVLPPPLFPSSVVIPPPGPPRPNRGFVLPTMVAPAVRPGPATPPPPRLGPSDYTRILGGASELRDPSIPEPAPEPESSAPPAPPRRSYLALWLLLNVVLILATGLVVYFALKRR